MLKITKFKASSKMPLKKRMGKTHRAKKGRPAKSIVLSAMFSILVLSFFLQDDPVDRLLTKKESPLDLPDQNPLHVSQVYPPVPAPGVR